MQASVVVVHGFSCSVARRIFLDWDRTQVPCIGRRILNRWTIREVFTLTFNNAIKNYEIHESNFFLQRNNAKKGGGAVSKFTFSAFPCLNEEEKSFFFSQNLTMESLNQVQCHFLEIQS